MAECPTSEVVPTKKEDGTPMECETSEAKSIKVDDIPSDKGALTLPVSGATVAAASTPVSDSESAMNPEDARMKEGSLALPASGATSAAASASVSDSECAMSSEDSDAKADALKPSAFGVTSAVASTPVSDSGCAMSPEDAHGKEGASTLPVSGAAFAAVSEVVTSPDDTHAKVAAGPSGSPEPSVPASSSRGATDDPEILSARKVAEIMSPQKEKVGILKGMKDAVKTTAKSFWKKLSPKKPEKAALAASAQDAESMEASETVKKPIKVDAYVSASRGSLELNSVASDEVTFDTELPTSSSDVFPPDQGSIATCDTATHASRLPSLVESCSEESPEPKTQESSGDRGDEAMDDGNVCLGESEHKAQESTGDRGDEAMDDGNVCLGESPEHKAQESTCDRGDEAMDDGNVEEHS